MTLTEFLLARIAEDEAESRIADLPDVYFTAQRVLAECEAKRRIMEDYAVLEADYRLTRSPESEARRFQALVSVGQLALIYADHPDYREDWRP